MRNFRRKSLNCLSANELIAAYKCVCQVPTTDPDVSIAFRLNRWSVHIQLADALKAVDLVSIAFRLNRWSAPCRKTSRTSSISSGLNCLSAKSLVGT